MPKLKVLFSPDTTSLINVAGLGSYVSEELHYSKMKMMNDASKEMAKFIQDKKQEIEQLKEQNQQLLTALQRIVLWDELDLKTMVDIGSMGQQRNYRAIAADAVLGQPCNVTAIKMKAVDDFSMWMVDAPFFAKKHQVRLGIFKATNQYLSDLPKSESNSVGKSAEGGENES